MNKRHRAGVIEHTPDDKLTAVFIRLEFPWNRSLNFGCFKTTPVAHRFALELARVINFDGPVVIDKELATGTNMDL